MRRWTVSFYWALTGAMIGFGLIGLMSTGVPFLIIGAMMVMVGLLRFGLVGTPAFFVDFGGVPALLLTISLAEQAFSATWSCSSISFTENSAHGSGTISADGSVTEVLCMTIPGQIVVLAAVSWCMALLGLAAVLLTRRSRPVRS